MPLLYHNTVGLRKRSSNAGPSPLALAVPFNLGEQEGQPPYRNENKCG
jgi:hypothetical protein